ncbi:aldehyde ferredoxin oxidoreductase C-terminal domain-containing protein [Methanotorris igneus]|uniref:Aldehyde ferredoxin oxidoreductase n=1 Tax=Methanotorris igneus (strain DSM 5666 / JCM 11834 / Kol 5) TaxID=880724 RepID=F6BBX9_METIK|nr:aldehyde ferredoxin oxidoreductase C-terminal domain-containing protein [Methanotorris igneus]AEF97259.1 Aldehyde ferredoxin oxidoreductase [Methanotorris igneus Kol 5]
MNVLIDASNKKYKIIEKEFLPLNWGIYWHKKFETWKYDVYDERNVFCFGRGVLPIVGGYRLIFSFRSPLWDGFHFSAMGGAGYVFKNTGLKNVAIIGRCENPSLLILDGEEDSLKVDFLEVKENFNRVYELSGYVLELFNEKNFRAFVVGPAAIKTNMGAIFSQTVRNGKFVEGSEDWAARGGGGSVLYRAHNILGVVFYGKTKKEKCLKHIVEEHYKKPYSKVILENTKKYRYHEETKTGGTLGNNYYIIRDLVPIFNWRTPYISREDRVMFLRKILEFIVNRFNKESIEPRKWTNCGEPCPVLCKKYRRGLKADYEPYESNGPLIGVFDIYAADKVVHTVDSLGFDAIEFGNLCSWAFELLDVGLLKPEEVGIEKPIFDINKFKDDEEILKNSNHNAEQAVKLANIVAYNKNEIGKILSLGKRKASKIFNEKFKDRIKDKKFNDYAVYVPFGENGEISPTMYWAIGNFMPYLIQGKYLTYYESGIFLEPEELAERSVERIFEEIALENLGICRFQRRWVAPILEKLLKEVSNIDLKSAIDELIKDICEYDKKLGYPTLVENERVKDLIVIGAHEFENEKWAKEFEKDREGKLNEYIKRVLDKYSELLGIDWRIKS